MEAEVVETWKVSLHGSLQINTQPQDAQGIFHLLHSKHQGSGQGDGLGAELWSAEERDFDPRRHILKAVRCGGVSQALN